MSKGGARSMDAASTGEMHGGPDKLIVYLSGFLCAMDRESKIAIPVSLWPIRHS